MRNLIQMTTAVGVATAVAGVLAACGGTSGGTAPAAAATPVASSSGNAQAYFNCLQQHGVTVPTARPTNRPTDRPSGGFGGGGGGGGFFGGQSQSPQMQAAQQACASLRPSGGFGFGGRGGTQLVAFRNCMSQQGVTIPTTRPSSTPTARPTGNNPARYLGGLDPNDPKVAAALKVCSPLLPSPGARPSSSPTG